MTYILDCREAFAKQKTGKGQWTWGLLEEMRTQGIPFICLATLQSRIPAEYSEYTVQFSTGWRFHWQVLAYLRKQQDAVYISPISYIVPAFLFGSVVKLYVVVHDLIAFRPGKHDRKARLIERLFLRLALYNANRIACVSTSTKDELLQRYSALQTKDVRVVFAGPMKESNPITYAPGSTLLCAATLSPRKNQLRLIRAYNSLPEELQQKHPLLLVGGRGWSDQAIVDLVAISPNVRWDGYVSDKEYEHLLSTCYALTLPSEYEGFGLQVLDALSKGVPVLTSQGGSLQEVVGEAGLIVDAYSVDSIAKGLQELCTNTELHARLQAMGPVQARTFSWQKTVSALLQ